MKRAALLRRPDRRPARLSRFALAAFLLLTSLAGRASDELFDRLDEALTTSALDGAFRARVSGTLDLEGYHLPTPAPDRKSTRLNSSH